MIGKNQAFRTNDLPGTATTENNDRVFERCLVDTVELFLGQLQAFLHHVVVHLLPQQHAPEQVAEITNGDGFDVGVDTTGAAPVTIRIPEHLRLRGQLVLMTHWRSQPVIDASPFIHTVFWNGITVLTAPYLDPDGKSMLVTAVNYAHQPLPVQMRVRGTFAVVHYESPDEPLTLCAHCLSFHIPFSNSSRWERASRPFHPPFSWGCTPGERGGM